MQHPRALHITARTAPGCRPFTRADQCAVLWGSLQRAFPKCYAAVIMPNHFHIVIPGDYSATQARWKAGVALRSVSRTLGPKIIRWQPVAEPQILEDASKASILIRYVHLNPARARIVSDPLAWRWSTLRKLVFQIPGWVDHPEVAALHGARTDTLAVKLLHFTLNDPFRGSEAKAPLAQELGGVRPTPGEVRTALCVILDQPILSARATSLLVHACRTLGHWTPPQIALALGLSLRGVYAADARFETTPQEAQILRLLPIFLANPRLLRGSEAESCTFHR